MFHIHWDEIFLDFAIFFQIAMLYHSLGHKPFWVAITGLWSAQQRSRTNFQWQTAEVESTPLQFPSSPSSEYYLYLPTNHWTCRQTCHQNLPSRRDWTLQFNNVLTTYCLLTGQIFSRSRESDKIFENRGEIMHILQTRSSATYSYLEFYSFSFRSVAPFIQVHINNSLLL